LHLALHAFFTLSTSLMSDIICLHVVLLDSICDWT